MLEKYLCALQGCTTFSSMRAVLMVNTDDNFENEIGYIPSDISETSIAGNSVLCNIVVQELMQRV